MGSLIRMLRGGSALLGTLAVLLISVPGGFAQSTTLIADFEGDPPKIIASPLHLQGWTLISGIETNMEVYKGALQFCLSTPNHAAGGGESGGRATHAASISGFDQPGFFLQFGISPGVVGGSGVSLAMGAPKNPVLGPGCGLIGNFDAYGHYYIQKAHNSGIVTSTNRFFGGELRLVIDARGHDGDGAGFLFSRLFPEEYRCAIGSTPGGNPFYPVPDMQNIPLGLKGISGSPAIPWSMVQLELATVAYADNIVVGHTTMAKLLALEVNQSVQNWVNTIELVTNKPTVVRAHLQALVSSDAGKTVSGKLRGFVHDQELPGSPLTPIRGNVFQDVAQLADDAAAVRGDPTQGPKTTLNFLLPRAWTAAGEVTLKFESDEAVIESALPDSLDENPTAQTTIHFKPSPPLRIAIIPIKVVNGSRVTPSFNQISELVQTATEMFPLSKIDSVRLPALHLRGTDGRVGDRQLLRALRSMRQRRPRLRGRMLMAIVRQEDGPTENAGSSLALYGVGWSTTENRDTLAHELGHTLFRPHATSGAHFPTFQDNDELFKTGACYPPQPELSDASEEDFPYFYSVLDPSSGSSGLHPTLGPMDQGEKIKIYGIQNVGGQFFPVSPYQSFELMSYCNRGYRWVSDHTYLSLLAAIRNRGNVGPPPNPERAPPPGTDYWMVRGSLIAPSGGVQWLPIQLSHEAPPEVAPGDYTLRYYDANHLMLGEVSFTPDRSLDPVPGLPNPYEFDVPIPSDDRIRQLELFHQTALVGTLVATAHPPQVHVVSPNGGESITTPVFTAQWTASDTDGDALSYTVEFSNDDGATWQVLASDLDSTSLEINATDVPGGPHCRIRVQAGDGFLTAEDTSDGSFTLPDNAPGLEILSPSEGAEFNYLDPISFEALADDLEDGVSDPSTWVWSSDRDGILGTGDALSVNAWNLSEGQHEISLSVSDTAGHVARATRHVRIVRFRNPSLELVRSDASPSLELRMTGTPPSQSFVDTSSNLVDWVPWQTISQNRLTETVAVTNLASKPNQYFRFHTEPLPTKVDALLRDVGGVVGYPTTFSISAQGQWLQYQWFFNGNPILQATNAQFTIDSLSLSNSGSYQVLVSNVLGLSTSSVARLTVVTNDYIISHSFGTPEEGLNGWGRLSAAADGHIYGCARNGGAASAGCLYRFDSESRVYEVLYSFTNATDGGFPLGGALLASDGLVYGTCSAGGKENAGTIWRFLPKSKQLEVLHHFRSTGDCRNPQSELFESSDHRLYGTAFNGGGFGNGGVFGIDLNGSNYIIVHGFRTTGNDGKGPVGGVVETPDGFLYGTTEAGGSATNGIIFRVRRDGSDYQILKHLGLVEGGSRIPDGTLLLASDGFLYGTTVAGGTFDFGTLFRIKPDGNDFTIVHQFGDIRNDVGGATVGLTETPSGYILGTTRIGGNFSQGGIFIINTSKSEYAVAHSFLGGNTDGARSRAPLLLYRGLLYGTTFAGGLKDQGVLLQFWISGVNP